MTSLYSLRTAPIGFTITKFTADLVPEATYNLTPQGFSYTCDCPANNRSVVIKPCRHKLMMPNLLPYADTDKFFDFDTQQFTTPLGDPHRIPPEEGEAQPLVGEAVHAEAVLVGEALGSSTKSHLVLHDIVEGHVRLPVAPLAQAPTIRRR